MAAPKAAAAVPTTVRHLKNAGMLLQAPNSETDVFVRVQNQIAGMWTGNFKFAREGRCLSANYGSVCTCISTGSDDPSTEGVCSDVSFYTRVRIKRLKSSYIVNSCQPVAGKYCFHVCAGPVHVETGFLKVSKNAYTDKMPYLYKLTAH